MSRELGRLVEATVKFFDKNNGNLLPFVGGKWRVDRTDTGPTSDLRRTDTATGAAAPYIKSAAIRLFWKVFA
jgi:hypothetical protein